MTQQEINDYERMKEMQEKHRHLCITCVNNRLPDPCWHCGDADVKAWKRGEGKYADPDKCCPKWYDEC